MLWVSTIRFLALGTIIVGLNLFGITNVAAARAQAGAADQSLTPDEYTSIALLIITYFVLPLGCEVMFIRMAKARKCQRGCKGALGGLV